MATPPIWRQIRMPGRELAESVQRMTRWQNESHKSVAAIARIGNSAAKMADSIRAMTKWREDLQKSLAITRIRNPAAQIAESIRAITNWHEDLHKSLAATLVRPPTIDLTNGLPQIAKNLIWTSLPRTKLSKWIVWLMDVTIDFSKTVIPTKVNHLIRSTTESEAWPPVSQS
jgi:hypothetical protein